MQRIAVGLATDLRHAFRNQFVALERDHCLLGRNRRDFSLEGGTTMNVQRLLQDANSASRDFFSTARALALLVVVGLLLAIAPPSASAQGKTILVFAPHPDDEALCCAG